MLRRLAKIDNSAFVGFVVDALQWTCVEQGRYLHSDCMSQTFSPGKKVRLLLAVTLLVNFRVMPT
jgi:hypothetical protein